MIDQTSAVRSVALYFLFSLHLMPMIGISMEHMCRSVALAGTLFRTSSPITMCF